MCGRSWSAIRRRRRDRRRPRRCSAPGGIRRLRKENFDEHGAGERTRAKSCPDELGRMGPRPRPASAAHGYRGPRLRRRLPDARSEPLCAKVIAIDRSEAVLARAEDRAPPPPHEHSLEARRAGASAAEGRQRRCGAALAGAAPRGGSGRRWPRPCVSCVRAAACCSSICGVTTNTGFATGSAIEAGIRRRRTATPVRRRRIEGGEGIGRRASRARSVHRPGRQRNEENTTCLTLSPSSNGFSRRLLLLDGAMGTMIQRYTLTEADFRGDRLKDHPKDVQGTTTC